MSKILRLRLIAIIAVGILLTNCGIGSQTFNQVVVSKVPSPTMVMEPVSICDVLHDPEEFNSRTITIQTTFFQIGNMASFGDDNCSQAHPVFQVIFTDGLVNEICGSQSSNVDLCPILKQEQTNGQVKDWQVDGSFTGRLESSTTDQGYTVNGRKYLFHVTKIYQVDRIVPIQSSHPVSSIIWRRERNI